MSQRYEIDSSGGSLDDIKILDLEDDNHNVAAAVPRSGDAEFDELVQLPLAQHICDLLNANPFPFN